MMEHSKKVAKEGIEIKDGFDVNVGLGSQTKVSASYGNGTVEGGVFFNDDNSGLYEEYQSYGIDGKIKIGDREGAYGEFSTNIKISQQKIKYFSGQSKLYDSASLAVNYSKELVDTEKLAIDLGMSAQMSIHGNHEDLSDGVSSLKGSVGVTLNGEYQATDNLTLNGNVSIGGDGGGNLRSENVDTLEIYEKYGIGAGFEYNGDSINYGVNGSYEQGLGYKKQSVSAEIYEMMN
ncbi:MAG: hypothetical protein Q9M97_08360 [Candidatus Gracilibacteria bacterium]|nr:hypothetical protein [Candidatus Gracilibacteria bacterium]